MATQLVDINKFLKHYNSGCYSQATAILDSGSPELAVYLVNKLKENAQFKFNTLFVRYLLGACMNIRNASTDKLIFAGALMISDISDVQDVFRVVTHGGMRDRNGLINAEYRLNDYALIGILKYAIYIKNEYLISAVISKDSFADIIVGKNAVMLIHLIDALSCGELCTDVLENVYKELRQLYHSNNAKFIIDTMRKSIADKRPVKKPVAVQPADTDSIASDDIIKDQSLDEVIVSMPTAGPTTGSTTRPTTGSTTGQTIRPVDIANLAAGETTRWLISPYSGKPYPVTTVHTRQCATSSGYSKVVPPDQSNSMASLKVQIASANSVDNVRKIIKEFDAGK